MAINPRGGAKSTPPAPQQLQSVELERLIHLISEGEIGGLVNTTYPGNSVFFNGTPLQDTSGNWQFGSGTNLPTIAQKTGTSSQTGVLGFSTAENTYTVGVQVVYATPITHTTSASNIDAVRLTVQFPAGLQSVDTSNGNINPTSVQMKVSVKLTSSGTWTDVITDTINGKADANFEKAYQVNRPTGTGTWDVKLTRLTADTTTPSTVADQAWFHSFIEIQDVNQTYPNSGYVALTYDARIAPNPWPQTFDIYGIKVAVPSNYNPTTRVYTGVWDGTMSATQTFTYNSTTKMYDRTYTGTLYVCDNPVWVLYDLLINKRYGLGEVIDPSLIDLASFYAAAVYNDGNVTVNATTEPRFRFNSQITAQDDPWKTVQMLASTFNAVVLVSGSLVTITQDRPTSASVLVTRADVAEGGFSYSTSSGATRYTAAQVAYNDASDSWLQKKVLIRASDLGITTTLPYNCTTAVAWGCTSESQAIRVGRWLVDTSLNSTDIISYRAPLSHAVVGPGTVIEVMDDDYANTTQGAQVVSVSGTTVVLDRAVTISSGVVTIDVLLADGVTLGTATVATTAGSYSTLTIASAFAQAVTPGATAIIKGAVSPRYFRVTDISEESDGFYSVQGIQYDSTKYSRIETGVATAAVVYSDLTSALTPSAVSSGSIVFSMDAPVAVDTVRRNLTMQWSASTNASTYTVQWSMKGTNHWTTVSGIGALALSVANVTTGTYDFNIFAVSKWGNNSPVVSASYTVDLTGTATAVINPVTSLSVLGGGTGFTGQDLTVVWTNPSTNASKNPAVKDFVVKVYTTTGTLLRTETVAGVAAGLTQTYTYSYSKNLDDGGPRRSVRIDVQARDTLNSVVTATSATLTNAAIATISGIAVSSANGGVKITYTLPTETDFGGVFIWRSTTTGFTPASTNLVYDTTANYIVDAVTYGTTYYYKLAAYDSFGKPLDGTGLNISSQVSGTAASPDGIPEVSALPSPTGYTGPKIVFLTTDGQLYSYIAGAWTATIPAVSGIADGAVTIAKFAAGLKPVEIVGSLPSTGNTQGRTVLLTGDNKMYRYTGSAWTTAVDSTDLTGTINEARIASLTASKLTGTLDVALIASNALDATKFASTLSVPSLATSNPTTGNYVGRLVYRTDLNKLLRYDGSSFVSTVDATDLTGTINEARITALAASKLTGLSITTTQISDGAITTPKMTANTIDGSVITAATLNASKIVTGSITSTQVAAGTITGTNIAGATITATNLVAGTITAAYLAAGAVTARTLAVGDFENLVQNGKGVNNDGWWSGATAYSGSTWWATNSVASSTSLRFATRDNLYGPLFQVRGGDQFWASMDTMSDGGGASTYTFSLGLCVYDLNQAVVGWYAIASRAAGTSGYYRATGSLALAATAAFAQVWVQIDGPGSTTFTTGGAHYATNMEIRRMNTGNLIVDGAITTNKMTANTIDGGVITAGTLNANKILAGSITTDRFTSNTIDGAVITAATLNATKLVANSITAGQIQAGAIGADQIAAGAIRTDKLFVTGRGKALNDDPACSDTTAWGHDNGTFAVQTDTTAPVGTTSIRCTADGVSSQIYTRSFPVEAGKTYKVTMYAKLVSGGGVMHLRQMNTNSAGANVNYTVTSLAGGTLENVTVPGAWTRYTGYITAGSGAVSANIYIHLNWYQAGVTDICDVRSEEYIGADLIVDGTITGTKIAATTILAGNLASNSVVAGKINAGAINASNLIVDGTIVSSHITANTLTGDRIAAGSIVASKIDTRGLDIRDGSGNVIFSSGVPLTSTYITPASGWLNSAISIAANGTLSGGSGGTVTIGGLGYTGALNATANQTDAVTNAGIATAATTANWTGVASRPANIAALGGSEAIQNSAISIGSNGALSGAGGGQVTLPGMGQYTFRCVSGGSSATSVPATTGLYVNGSYQGGYSRSYSVFVITRSTGALVSVTNYDVFGGSAAASMAAQLNGLTSSQVVVVTTWDEPATHRTEGYLPDAMYRCGASRVVFGSPNFQFRSAYVLIGIPGCGEGNGAEGYQGSVSSDTNAWVDMSFTLLNGSITGVSNAYTPRTLSDYSYTGDLNATYGANWSTNVTGASTVNSNIATAGTTANWTGVSGTGKPSDNASSDLSLVASANISLVGNTATMTGGATWNEQVYSRDAYVGGAYASGVIDGNAGHMFGLNTDPTTDASYTSIDYAIHTSTYPSLFAYESSAGYYIGTYAANDVLAVVYDGSTVKYLQNGNVLRTVSVAAGIKFYFDSSFAGGVTLKNIRFGPYGNPSAIQASNPITSGNVSTYIASAAIGSAQIDAVYTSNYAQDGSGNPTAGAKLQSAGTALKVASGSFQLGPVVFTDYWFRLVNAIDGSLSGGKVVWRGNNDITTLGGAPNINTLSIKCHDISEPTGNNCFMSFSYTIQPTASSDNLDSLRYMKIECYRYNDTSALLTRYVTLSDRLYANATDSNSANAVSGDFNIMTVGTGGNTAWYHPTSPNSFYGHFRITMYNAYGASATKWFHGSSGYGGTTAMSNLDETNLIADNTAPTGAPSSGGGGGGGSWGGYCPAPWVKVTLLGGRKVNAGDLATGMRVVAVNDGTLEEVKEGGEVRDVATRWEQRIRLTLLDGRQTEWSFNHRFFVVGKGWVRIQDLRAGDVIAGPSESIVASVLATGEGQVVSFRVDGAGTYFGDDLLCHNVKYSIP